MDVYGGPLLDGTVSQVTATNSVSLGERALYKGEDYVYCYNAGGASIAQGNGVKLVTGCSGYSVAATSLTDVANPCVGVAKNVAIPSGEYGWIMQKGFTSVVMVSATTADAQAIALGVDGKFIAGGGTGVGTGAVAGYALNANTGAGGTVYATIKAFG